MSEKGGQTLGFSGPFSAKEEAGGGWYAALLEQVPLQCICQKRKTVNVIINRTDRVNTCPEKLKEALHVRQSEKATLFVLGNHIFF
jgi:hypothetical protein